MGLSEGRDSDFRFFLMLLFLEDFFGFVFLFALVGGASEEKNPLQRLSTITRPTIKHTQNFRAVELVSSEVEAISRFKGQFDIAPPPMQRTAHARCGKLHTNPHPLALLGQDIHTILVSENCCGVNKRLLDGVDTLQRLKSCRLSSRSLQDDFLHQ